MQLYVFPENKNNNHSKEKKRENVKAKRSIPNYNFFFRKKTKLGI